jgi:hypothetical protein
MNAVTDLSAISSACLHFSLTFLLPFSQWIWSTAFHARDFLLTERLDYYSANILVIFSCTMAIIRILRLYTFKKQLFVSALSFSFSLCRFVVVSLTVFFCFVSLLLGANTHSPSLQLSFLLSSICTF